MAAKAAGQKEMYAWVFYKRDADNSSIFNSNSDHGHTSVYELDFYNR